MEDRVWHEIAACREVDQMLHATRPDDGREKIAGGEELISAREIEEYGVDLVFDKIFFDPNGVLDGAVQDGYAV